MRIISFLVIIFSVLNSSAELSDFEKDLMIYKTHQTKETIVEKNGQTYRKIEYEGKFYYLQLSQPNEPNLNYDVNCKDNEININELPSRIYSEIKIIQRSSLFIDALKVSCTGKILPALRIGFTLPDSPKEFIKNKKIILFPQPGFYGEF
jgi:hypothetical protein